MMSNVEDFKGNQNFFKKIKNTGNWKTGKATGNCKLLKIEAEISI